MQAWDVEVSEGTKSEQVLTIPQRCDAMFKVRMSVLGPVHLLGQRSGLYKEDRVLFARSENVHHLMWRDDLQLPVFSALYCDERKVHWARRMAVI